MIINYNNGAVVGDNIMYYPNGLLYAIENYNPAGKCLLVECHDTTGKVLAENGNGNWIKFDYKGQETEEGAVKDSLEDGEWHETYFKNENYITTYQKGIVIASTDPNRDTGEGTVFTAVEHEPQFNGDFGVFLAKTVIYPEHARRNNIQGKVILTFVVEKDGRLSNVRVLHSPDQDLSNEALRVIKLSSWTAGTQNGRPVRVQYTLPIGFNE